MTEIIKKKRILIVDDSAVVRQLLTRIISKAPDMEVVGSAPDPYVARDKVLSLKPDVITLDIEMPRMDGLTFLQKLMKSRSTPVVMVSSLTRAGAESTLAALELGAVDFVAKPNGHLGGGLEQLEDELIKKLRSAASSRVPKTASSPLKSPGNYSALPETTSSIIAVGSSTGGTEALKVFLAGFPATAPGIVIVQHMPEHFTIALAKRLDGICNLHVKEAADGDGVSPGNVLIAPGNRHMVLRRSGARYFVNIIDGPMVCNVRPSVDVLFQSVAKYAGKNAVGIILTGMGSDGANGIKKMKDAGAQTIAQDEETSIVFGMPKEAIKTGAIDSILPLNAIPNKAMKMIMK